MLHYRGRKRFIVALLPSVVWQAPASGHRWPVPRLYAYQVYNLTHFSDHMVLVISCQLRYCTLPEGKTNLDEMTWFLYILKGISGLCFLKNVNFRPGLSNAPSNEPREAKLLMISS